MGGAPIGGGRGKGDEDEEHKRKVLIEADAEGVFGSDVLTAPQVIGDDEYEATTDRLAVPDHGGPVVSAGGVRGGLDGPQVTRQNP
jgi:hypothetical protein